VKAAVVDAKEPSVAAAREVLRALPRALRRRGRAELFLSLPPPVRTALSRDAQAPAGSPGSSCNALRPGTT